MMVEKQKLHELLLEDQEPFLLNNYIADRRCQLLKKQSNNPKTNLAPQRQEVIKKRKPISQNFRESVCFLSINNNSPDPRKSPLFHFQSPVKTPNCKSSPKPILLQIPASTSALLLEAALRVQKQASSAKSKNNNGFGLFGSLLRRLTNRTKTRKREIGGGCDHGLNVSVKDILRWDSSFGPRKSSNNQEIMVGANVGEKNGCELMVFDSSSSCYCNRARPSSAVWSEKSLDLDFDTSSSTSHSHEEDQELLEGNIDDFASYDKNFCDSPFHFVLRTSPSSRCCTPDFSSPVTSPCRHKIEAKENNCDAESLKKFQVQKEEEDKDDKEQCSPVSVLDPPFEDDDEYDDDGHDGRSEDDGFDHLECSYAIVQRAKQQLLQKLRRFEKLAELDPVELEKRMLEQDEEVDDEVEDEEECEGDDEYLVSSNREKNIETFIIEELNKSSFERPRKIQGGMKRLISDLIVEEERKQNLFVDRQAMVKGVCKRLESWKDVESNTIDMMVEQDYIRELSGWKRNQKEVEETAFEIELGIFGLLVEELSEELVGLTGI